MPKRHITNRALHSARGFSSRHTSLLAERGIVTASDLVALGQLHECHRGLRKLLAISEVELDALLKQARQLLPTSVADMSPTPIPMGRLGCVTDGDDRPAAFAAPRTTSFPWRDQIRLHKGLPKQVRLIDRFQSVRDQGQRGTCVAHALVALREYLLAQTQDLSEQFLYWDCKQNDGHDGPGTYISTGVECLERDGVCEESLWPYNPESTDDEGQGPPPDGCASNAEQFRLATHVELDADVDDLKACLAYGDRGQGLPVVLGVPVFPSWGNAETTRTGKVFMPFDEEETLGGHALALAGYEDDDSAPGGGFFIFRNSWGTTWASESDAAPGYGLLPYAYVETYARACVTSFATETVATGRLCNSSRLADSWILPCLVGFGLGMVIIFGNVAWQNSAVARTGVQQQPAHAITTDSGTSCPISSERTGRLQDGPLATASASGDSCDRLRSIVARLMEALHLLEPT